MDTSRVREGRYGTLAETHHKVHEPKSLSGQLRNLACLQALQVAVDNRLRGSAQKGVELKIHKLRGEIQDTDQEVKEITIVQDGFKKELQYRGILPDDEQDDPVL